ncbi:DUF859 domain-containing protein [Streptococcus gallolyticus subsp. gallolyticus]|uniref:DUF859 family phage minor structural protein n=1 Tax=Streptococcus gallolyticus TaxID=315405 RepID=UPI002283A939|nr:DUF859 family phage minor structural protein [Streptococcus gallolyticus]MCY7178872.1 DUF859 domain-containing protein [Streptococcus gallolyticus subsp. gallolyticus]
MATAQFSGQYGHNMTLEVWSDWNRQDTVNNRSTVNLQARLRTNGYASVTGVTAPMTIHVDGGDEIVNASVNIGTNSSLLIFGKDYVVSHDGNGNKTVNISFKVDINVGGYGSATVRLSIPLPQIKRASTISDVTGTLGSPMTLDISRKDSSYTHNLKYEFGSLSGTIATGVGTSVSWTPPLSLATAMPNRTSDWGQIVLETYSGSTKIGQTNCILTLNVPTSMTPSLGSITLTDSNTAVKNLLNTANTFAEIVSDIKVAFNDATGVQDSAITGYHAEIVNKNQSTNANNGNLGLMKWNGSAQVKAWVTDSRGRSSNAVTTDITVLEYFLPTLTFTAVRGDTNQSSDKIVVSRTAKIAPLKIGNVQKNSFKLSFKTAPFGSTTYTADTGAGVNDKVTNTLTNSKATLSGTFDIGKSYEVYGVLEDALTSSGTVKAPPVSPEKMVMGMAENAVSFGKFPENTNAVDSDWVYKYKNKDIQHHQLTSNAGRSPYNASGTVDLNTKTVNSFFSCNEPTNGPTVGTGLNQFYVSVYSESDNYLSQQAIQKKTGRLFTRTRDVGVWTNWIEYAPLNSVAEFTAVNQTKVYTATINGPYGANLSVARCGNIVNASMDAVITATLNVSGTASETIPIGYRPAINQHLRIIGSGGGGTSAALFTNSYVDVTYSSDGKISHRTKLTDAPLAFKGSISWITSDPFPS